MVERLEDPNLAKHDRPAVDADRDYCVLGRPCLLVSEPRRVAQVPRDRFPGTDLQTADLYTAWGGHKEDARPALDKLSRAVGACDRADYAHRAAAVPFEQQRAFE